MKRLFIYFQLELKKYKSILLGLLIGILLILGIFCGIACLVHNTNQNTKAENTTKVAIAMKEDEPFMDWLFSILTNTETLKESYQFENILPEEADALLENGTYNIAFIIPENFIFSLIDGSNKQIVVRFGPNQATISSFLMAQFSETISSIILDTESSIYAMNDYYWKNKLKNRAKDEQALNIEYIQKLLKRETLFQIEEIENYNALSYSAYYFSSALILFLLFWGLLCPFLLKPENKAFQEKLHIFGISVWKQVIVRFSALLCVFVILYGILALLASLGISLLHIQISGVDLKSFWSCMKLFSLLLFLVPMIVSYIGMVFEVIEDTITSILFLFLSVLIQAYCSGYFYPLSFLPKALQHIAKILPTYTLFQYASDCLKNTWSLRNFARLWLYMIFLLLFTIGLKLVIHHSDKIGQTNDAKDMSSCL